MRRLSLLLVVVGSISTITILQAFADDQKPASAERGDRYFEMRKYYAAEGKLDALNARFRNHTVNLFKKHGMDVIGFWVPNEGPEANKVLIYLLAFPSKEAREASFKGFVNDPEWKKAKEASEVDGKLVDKIESTFLSPTDYSDIR